MSDNIVTQIDEMGTRIEDLEKSIGELVNEAQTMDEAANLAQLNQITGKEFEQLA